MQKLFFFILLASFFALPAKAEFGYQKVATTRRFDDKRTGAFNGLFSGRPSIAANGDVVFWADTELGQKIFRAKYNAEKKKYEDAVSIYSSYGFLFPDIYDQPSPVSNAKGDVAFWNGDRESSSVLIGGCGQPNPSAFDRMKNVKKVVEKPLFPVMPEASLRRFKEMNLTRKLNSNYIPSIDSLAYRKIDDKGVVTVQQSLGNLFCPPQRPAGKNKWEAYRVTVAGLLAPGISINSLGDTAYLVAIYKENINYETDKFGNVTYNAYGAGYTYAIVRRLNGQASKLMFIALQGKNARDRVLSTTGEVMLNSGAFPVINDQRDIAVFGYSVEPNEQEADARGGVFVIRENGNFQPVVYENAHYPYSSFELIYPVPNINNSGLVFYSAVKTNGQKGMFASDYRGTPENPPINGNYTPLLRSAPDGPLTQFGFLWPAPSPNFNLGGNGIGTIAYGAAIDNSFIIATGREPNVFDINEGSLRFDGTLKGGYNLGKQAVNSSGQIVFSASLMDGSEGIYVASQGKVNLPTDCGNDGITCSSVPSISPLGTPTSSCYAGCEAVGQPVNVATGAMWHRQTDVAIPSRTGELRLDRTYTSNATANAGDFGPNWSFGYETKLILPAFAPGSVRRGLVKALGAKGKKAQEAKELPALKGADMIWIDEFGGPWLVQHNKETNSYSLPKESKALFVEQLDYYELTTASRETFYFYKATDRRFGKIFKKIDSHGEETTFTYDEEGRLSSVSMPMAGALQFARDSKGRIVEAYRSRDGLRLRYTYTSEGKLASVVNVDNSTYRFEYNEGQVGQRAHGMLSKIIDPLNRETIFTYYNDGRAFKQIEPGGAVTSFYYKNGETEVVGKDKASTRYFHDPNFRPVKVIYADGSRKYQSWGASGFLNTEQNELGGITRYGHDERGNITSIQLPGNSEPTRFTYHPYFNKVSSIQPILGAPTEIGVDSKGDALFIARGTTRVDITRDAFGNILSTANGTTTYFDQRNADGLITYKYNAYAPEFRSYDSRNRLNFRQIGGGRNLIYSYDDMDRVIKIEDSAGPDTFITYDLMGKVLETRLVDGSSIQSTKYSYDLQDRITAVTDAQNRVTRFEYDAQRVIPKPSAIVDPAGRSTYFSYDRKQRLVRRQEPNGAVTSYTYDVNDRLTSVTDANGGVTRYSYDLNGNKIREIRPSVAGTEETNREIEYYYDLENRLVKKRYVSKRGIRHREELFEYDNLDRVVKRVLRREANNGYEVEDESTYSYENLLEGTFLKTADNGVVKLGFSRVMSPPFAISGYAVQAAQAGNPLGLLEGQYEIGRNNLGELATVGRNGSNIFAKTFDPAGRLTQVQSGNFFINLGYDGFGRKASETTTDGVTGSWAYDSLNRVTNVTWTGPTPISQTLTYDPLTGNISQIDREHSSYSLSYNANDELTGSAFTGNPGVPAYNKTFEYDLLGNAVAGSRGPGTFVNNFLIQNGSSAFLSDLEGFGETVRETTGATTKNYSYRADGKIAEFQSGGVSVGYHYDGLDRLVAKTINDGNQYTQTFAHLADENRVLLGKAGDGSLATYLDGQGVAERLGEVKGGIGKAYVTDHLGSVLNGRVPILVEIF